MELNSLRNSLRANMGPAQRVEILQKICYSTSDNFEKLSCYVQIIDLFPAQIEHWEKLGNLAKSLGNVAYTIRAYEGLYKMTNNKNWIYKLAKVYYEIYQFPSARYLALACEHPKSAELLKKIDGNCRVDSRFLFRGLNSRNATSECHEIEWYNWGSLILRLVELQQSENWQRTNYIFVRLGQPPQIQAKPAPQRTYNIRRPVIKNKQIATMSEKLKQFVVQECAGDIPVCISPPPPAVFEESVSCLQANPESDFLPLLDRVYLFDQIITEVIATLCRNTPTPSKNLTLELSEYVFKLFVENGDWLKLSTEYLTLLEIGVSHFANNKEISLLLDKNLSCDWEDDQNLKIRMYYALAKGMYRETQGISAKTESRFIKAYNNAVRAEKLINGQSIYLWWINLTLTQTQICTTKDEICHDLLIIDVEKGKKKRGLDFVEKIVALLMKNIHTDKPLFYWKKIKGYLKTLEEVDPSQIPQLAKCISGYTSALLYNIEEGVSISKEYDLPLLVKTATLCASSNKGLRIAMSLLNIMKYYPDVQKAIMNFIVVLFGHTNPQQIPAIFSCCYSLFDLKSQLSEIHDICMIFEKAIYNSGDTKSLETVYKYMYGIDFDDVKVNLKNPHIPKTKDELIRVTTYIAGKLQDKELPEIEFDWPKYNLNTNIRNFLERIVSRIPENDTQEIYKIINAENVIYLTEATEIEKAYSFILSKFSEYLIAKMQKKRFEMNASFYSLVEKYILQALSYSQTSRNWLVLAQFYFTRWIYKYDSATFTIESPDSMEFHRKACVCFSLAGDIPYSSQAISIMEYLLARATTNSDYKIAKQRLKSVAVLKGQQHNSLGNSNSIYECLARCYLKTKNLKWLVYFEKAVERVTDKRRLEPVNLHFQRAKVIFLSDQIALEQLKESSNILAVYWAAKISGDLNAIAKLPLNQDISETAHILERPLLLYKKLFKIYSLYFAYLQNQTHCFSESFIERLFDICDSIRTNDYNHSLYTEFESLLIQTISFYLTGGEKDFVLNALKKRGKHLKDETKNKVTSLLDN